MRIDGQMYFRVSPPFLSQLTGENLTQTVTKAIVERLERVKKEVQNNRKGLSEKLLVHHNR
jgi:hypothetical protein